jgi:hypothetical protein
MSGFDYNNYFAPSVRAIAREYLEARARELAREYKISPNSAATAISGGEDDAVVGAAVMANAAADLCARPRIEVIREAADRVFTEHACYRQVVATAEAARARLAWMDADSNDDLDNNDLDDAYHAETRRRNLDDRID